jgi:hypothetical protein
MLSAMKTYSRILSACFVILTVTTSGLAQQEKQTSDLKTKESDKTRERKETKKREEKENLKHPPELRIPASPSTVRTAIIRRMSEGSAYRLSDESESRLVFRNPIGGFRGALMSSAGGGANVNPDRILSFVIAPDGDGTIVILNMGVEQSLRGGSVRYQNMNDNKQWHREGHYILIDVASLTAGGSPADASPSPKP